MTDEMEKEKEVSRGLASVSDKNESLCEKDPAILRELVYLGLELSTFTLWARTASRIPTKAGRKKEAIDVMADFSRYMEGLLVSARQDIAKIHVTVVALKKIVGSFRGAASPLTLLYTTYLARFSVLCTGMIHIPRKLDAKAVAEISNAIDKGSPLALDDKDVLGKMDEIGTDEHMKKLEDATNEMLVGYIPSYGWAMPGEKDLKRYTAKIFVDVYKLACKHVIVAYMLMDTLNTLRVMKEGQIGQSLGIMFAKFMATYRPLIVGTLVRFTPEARALFIEASIHMNQMHSWTDDRPQLAILKDLDIQVHTAANRREMHRELLKSPKVLS